MDPVWGDAIAKAKQSPRDRRYDNPKTSSTMEHIPIIINAHRPVLFLLDDEISITEFSSRFVVTEFTTYLSKIKLFYKTG